MVCRALFAKIPQSPVHPSCYSPLKNSNHSNQQYTYTNVWELPQKTMTGEAVVTTHFIGVRFRIHKCLAADADDNLHRQQHNTCATHLGGSWDQAPPPAPPPPTSGGGGACSVITLTLSGLAMTHSNLHQLTAALGPVYIAHHVMSLHITLRHIMSHMLRHIVSHHTTSHRVTSCHLTSSHMPRHITSRHIASHHVTHATSHHITSYHVTSCHIMSLYIITHKYLFTQLQ